LNLNNHNIEGDKMTSGKPVLTYLREKDYLQKPNTIFMKNQYYFNVKHYGDDLEDKDQPLFATIIRHPVDWFVSTYFAKRFGSNISKPLTIISPEDKAQTIDDCIAAKNPNCLRAPIKAPYLQYLCGADTICAGKS